MPQSVDAEVLMAAGYSVFLILTALGLEWIARHSHRRSEHLRIAGFKYHHQYDTWERPTGERLTRVAFVFAPLGSISGAGVCLQRLPDERDVH